MTTELLTDPGHSRADLATVQRAIREGWDIPEQLLSTLPKIAGAMALNAKEKSPVRLKAIATIIKMKEQNDKPDTPNVPQPQPQTTINVGVNVDNVPNTGRGLASQILARLGTNGISEVVSGVHAG